MPGTRKSHVPEPAEGRQVCLPCFKLKPSGDDPLSVPSAFCSAYSNSIFAKLIEIDSVSTVVPATSILRIGLTEYPKKYRRRA